MNVPKYTYDDKVRFRFPRKDAIEVHTGIVIVVDAYGTMEQSEEPSYDIRIPEKHAIYKHVRESWVIGKEE